MKPWEETWEAHGPIAGKFPGGIVCDGKTTIVVAGNETFAVQREVDDAKEKLPGRLQLAAAAPDLYRALEEVSTLLGNAHDPGGVTDYWGKINLALDKADAALKKARGE